MKLVLLLFIPFIGFSQIKLQKISLFDSHVQMQIPAKLSAVTNDIWVLKYHDKPKPMLALSDENGEVNLIGDSTNQRASESQLASFKDYELASTKKSRSDAQILDQGIKSINNKNVAFIKFITQASDQKIFNYYFFTIYKGKILFFTFNCIEKLQKDWEPIADNIINSLQILN